MKYRSRTQTSSRAKATDDIHRIFRRFLITNAMDSSPRLSIGGKKSVYTCLLGDYFLPLTLIQQPDGVGPFLAVQLDLLLQEFMHILAGLVHLMVLVLGLVQRPRFIVGILLPLILVLAVARSVHIHVRQVPDLRSIGPSGPLGSYALQDTCRKIALTGHNDASAGTSP